MAPVQATARRRVQTRAVVRRVAPKHSVGVSSREDHDVSFDSELHDFPNKSRTSQEFRFCIEGTLCCFYVQHSTRPHDHLWNSPQLKLIAGKSTPITKVVDRDAKTAAALAECGILQM